MPRASRRPGRAPGRRARRRRSCRRREECRPSMRLVPEARCSMAHEIAGAAPCTGEKRVYPAVASAISEGDGLARHSFRCPPLNRVPRLAVAARPPGKHLVDRHADLAKGAEAAILEGPEQAVGGKELQV